MSYLWEFFNWIVWVTIETSLHVYVNKQSIYNLKMPVWAMNLINQNWIVFWLEYPKKDVMLKHEQKTPISKNIIIEKNW